MTADIFNKASISATNSTAVGSAFNIERITNKSVFISALTAGSGTGTGSQLFVTIDVSPDNTNWFTIDNKRYESGTATQTDVFSYNSHFPFIRTQAIGSNVGAMSVTTTVTGRGA